MVGREEPHMDEYKEVMKDLNYDMSCVHASLPVSISGNFNCLTSVIQCVHAHTKPNEPKYTYQTLPSSPLQKITCVRSSNPYSVL
jgi:hypothetical protein